MIVHDCNFPRFCSFSTTNEQITILSNPWNTKRIKRSQGERSHALRHVVYDVGEASPKPLHTTCTALNMLHERAQSLELRPATVPGRGATVFTFLVCRTL